MRQSKIPYINHYLTIRAFFHSVKFILSIRSNISKLARRDAEVYALGYRTHTVRIRSASLPVVLAFWNRILDKVWLYWCQLKHLF
jgi:hypothetical protein